MRDSPPGPVKRVWWFPLGALPLVLIFLVAGLVVTGAAAPLEFFDPGPLVRWALPVVTGVTWVGVTVAIGAFVLCAVVLPRPTGASGGVDRARAGRPLKGTSTGGGSRPAGPDREPVRTVCGPSVARRPEAPRGGVAWAFVARVGGGAAVVWALAQLAHLLLTHASVLGAPIGGPGYGAQLAQFVTDIELGRNLALTTLLAAVVAVLGVAVAGYTSAAWTGGLALAALLPVALTGHAAGTAGHDFAVSSWWLHVGGVTVWAGGLAVLCVASSRLGRDLPDVVERYSRIAVWAFAVTVIAGAASAWVRLSTPGDLVGHPYGRLLLVKVVLTVALGLAGWTHRRVTIPAIRAHAGTPGTGAGLSFWRLAGVEVLVMGAVVGVAVALGSSAPPAPQEPVLSAGPVYVLTRYPEPSVPTALAYLTQWRLEPLTALATAAGLLVYLAWVWRLRRRGGSWSPGRTMSWVVGVLLFFWVTNGGPAVYGSVLFSGHTAQHMLLIMVVPLFLVLAAPVTLALRALPARKDGSRGAREWLLALVRSRWAAFFSHPLVAAVNLAGSLVVFYSTPLFEWALTSHAGHLLMVVHFTAMGYLFATAIIGIDPGPARPSYRRRLVVLGATVAFLAFFGVSLISQTTLLAPGFFGQLGLSWGVDALADQQEGGAIAGAIGALAAVTVAIAAIRQHARPAELSSRRADRDENAELGVDGEMLDARRGPPTAPADHDASPLEGGPGPRRSSPLT